MRTLEPTSLNGANLSPVVNSSLLVDILQKASVGIALLSIDGRFLSANEAMANALGEPGADLIGKRFIDFSHPFEWDRERKSLLRLGTGLLSSYSTEKRLVRKDGQVSWYGFEVKAVPDPTGRGISHLVLVCHDITARVRAEDRARVAEERSRKLFNTDLTGVVYFDGGGRIQDANDAFLRIMECSREELQRGSLTLQDLTADEWCELEEKMLAKLQSGQPAVNYFKEGLCSDGRKIPMVVSASLLDPGDSISGMAVVQDLTELFEARRVAEENQSKVSLALDAANIGIWELRPDSNEVVWDSKTSAFFGLPYAEKVTPGFFKTLVHDDDWPKLKAMMKSLVERDSSSSKAVEFRVPMGHGERVLMVTGRGFGGGDGTSRRAIGTVVDVTETKVGDRKISESEDKFRTFAEAVPQIVWIVHSSTKTVYFNRHWSEYTGIAPCVGLEEAWTETVHPDDLEDLRGKWLESQRMVTPLNAECRIRSVSGDFRWHIMRIMPLRDGCDSLIRWFGTCTEIDEQRRIADEMRLAKEAAEKADQMKSSFLANMSHEIRTPLGAILGFTELLADPTTDEAEKKEFVQIIARNGQSLSRIVDDILDLSKVEAGLLKVEKTKISPRLVVSDAVTLFQERARIKGLSLELKLDSETPDCVFSDSIRLRQILSNLISNAIKFTERGGVTVSVFAEAKDWLSVAVCDTGIGIGREQISKLFQPFSQGDDSMSRRFGGTGLGLHLSRKLAEAMGGCLDIESSEPGHGTCFRLRIPVGAPVDASVISLPVALRETPKIKTDLELPLLGKSILVVDDSKDNQQLIERFLAKKGADVDFADNGLIAVERALNAKYDLILMDLQMPEMDGFEATETLRQEKIRTPIVALTAHVVEDVRRRCRASGCDGFLSKPIQPQELVKVVLAHIRK